jgi:hypothetical protein
VAGVLRNALFKTVDILRIKPVQADQRGPAFSFYYGRPFIAVYRVEARPEVIEELSKDIKQLHTSLRSTAPPQHIRNWVENRFSTVIPAVLSNRPWIIYGEWSMTWDTDGTDSGYQWTGTLEIELRVPPET